jgi:leader peptidase (prepilin peptidase)/N-methyltransferase
MALAAALVLVTFIDLTDWTIPNEVTFPGVPIGIVCALVAMFYPDSGLRTIGPFEPIFDSLLGVVVGGGIIYALDKLTLLLLKKPGMGFGDVKLMAMLGAFFGVGGAFLVIVLASVIGSTVGVIQILVGRSRSTPPSDEEGADEEGARPVEAKGSGVGAHYLPFGPSLSFAGLIVMFYGTEIVNAYFDYLDMPV